MKKSSKKLVKENITGSLDPFSLNNLSTVTQHVAYVIKHHPKIEIGDISIGNPSKKRLRGFSFVSLFLYKISENNALKNQERPYLTEQTIPHSFSSMILNYLITVHSKDHLLEMNVLEKIVGAIYSNPFPQIMNQVERVKFTLNYNDDPVEVWNKLFPTTPYRLSILLTVTGTFVTYPSTNTKRITSKSSDYEVLDAFNKIKSGEASRMAQKDSG